MDELFRELSAAVEGAPLAAAAASFTWGVLSVVLSPCHLASIPLIVGFIGGQGQMTGRRAFATSSLFALGILVTIGVIAAVTAAAGRMLGYVGAAGNYAMAGVFLFAGLYLLDVVPMPFGGPGQVSMKRRGLLAGFVLGLVFGVALGPCTFAFMAPVIGAAAKVSATNAGLGAALVGLYGVGHCAIIAAAGTSAGVVQRYLDWNERSRGATVLKRVCGVLVILGGLWLIYSAP